MPIYLSCIKNSLFIGQTTTNIGGQEYRALRLAMGVRMAHCVSWISSQTTIPGTADTTSVRNRNC